MPRRSPSRTATRPGSWEVIDDRDRAVARSARTTGRRRSTASATPPTTSTPVAESRRTRFIRIGRARGWSDAELRELLENELSVTTTEHLTMAECERLVAVLEMAPRRSQT
jgi:hypothetical protein